jgi:hypothetical protein
MFSEYKETKELEDDKLNDELEAQEKNNRKEESQMKAIKYKNMGIPWSNRKNTTSLSNLEAMLETERIENDNENWSKLSKTIKIKKLLVYANKYKEENNLSEEDYNKLIIFFRDCLDKKKLQRVKDVDYNRETGEITNISALIHNKTSNHFTLKNIYKKVSTVKCVQKKKPLDKIENEEI